jgi:adenine-specific DNA-methyltransferase
MARSSRRKSQPDSRSSSEPAAPATSYRYDDKRKNIPPAGLAAQGRVEERPSVRYSYDPHLPPELRFDASGRADGLPELLAEAGRRPLTAAEVKLLHEALRSHQPWLEWAGKAEKGWFDVDPVALHIHERVSAEAILKVAARQPLQRGLFADPELEYREAVKFYQHDIEWANRLILGDSLVVMNSLAKREDLAGKVQMIYMDPPYGIKFASNFQPFVGKREVKDREQDLTREPEQVKAYRDTWKLGVHTYLGYLRDRLIVARDLLSDSGSVFVQISDENLHRVRILLDEVFGSENFAAIICFSKTGGLGSNLLYGVFDFILWYAKDLQQVRYHQLYNEKNVGDDVASKYRNYYLPDGSVKVLTPDKIDDLQNGLISSMQIFRLDNLTSQGNAVVEFEFHGKVYLGGWKTNPAGMNCLKQAERIVASANSLNYVRYLDDFSAVPLNTDWQIGGIQSRSDPKIYVVQTATTAIERCILMTTAPGDLILDPTAGSGTTAYVAEQWGRRWITIDTSRVAVALARQRLLTAKFDYYQPQKPDQPLDPDTNNFVYRTVPHITLKSIAQNQGLDPIFARWEPLLAEKLAGLNAALREVTPELRTKLQQKLLAKEKTTGKSSITDADRRRWLLPQPATIGGGGGRVYQQMLQRVEPQPPAGRHGISPLTATPTGRQPCKRH